MWVLISARMDSVSLEGADGGGEDPAGGEEDMTSSSPPPLVDEGGEEELGTPASTDMASPDEGLLLVLRFSRLPLTLVPSKTSLASRISSELVRLRILFVGVRTGDWRPDFERERKERGWVEREGR